MNPKYKVTKKVQQYKILDYQIGEGAFGKVFLSQDTEKNELCAVKVIDKGDLTSVHQFVKEQITQNIVREASYHKKLEHKNIVKLYDVYETKSNIYFFQEYCQMNLKEYIQTKKCISENEARKILQQIVDAFLYMESVEIDNDMVMTFGGQKEVLTKGLQHRDIKPENILILNGVIKLADFGLSRENLSMRSSIRNSVSFGTPAYLAPECMTEDAQAHDSQKHSQARDVWATGIVLYQIVFQGQHPYYSNSNSVNTLMEQITKQPLKFPSNISNDLTNLLQWMLHTDPNKRLTWLQISKHNWVTNQVYLGVSICQYFKQNHQHKEPKKDTFLLQFYISLFEQSQQLNIKDNQELLQSKIQQYSKNQDPSIYNQQQQIKQNLSQQDVLQRLTILNEIENYSINQIQQLLNG